MHLAFVLAKIEKLTSLEATKRVSPLVVLKFLTYYLRQNFQGFAFRLVTLLVMFQDHFQTFRVNA